METSALNAAHAKERRAEALLRGRKFDEAAKFHEQAAHLLSEIQIRLQPDLDDVRYSTSDKYRNYHPLANSSKLHVAVESIQLQREYYRKQAAFARMKKVQYEDYKAMMDLQENELVSSKQAVKHCTKANTSHPVITDSGDRFLHNAIDRAMDEQDSLLDLILKPQNGNVTPKRPKDPAVVLEELRTVNSQLRSLIGSLLGQLEASQLQVKMLTEQLEAASASDNGSQARINEDNSISLSPLPPLAPLEMPPFNFSTL